MDALGRAQRSANLSANAYTRLCRANITGTPRRMDSMEVNKGLAAILIAGIGFFMCGLIGDNLVRVTRLEKPAIEIKGGTEEVAAAGPAVELPPIAPLLAKADAEAGGKLAKKLCASCHTFTEGGKASVGPNLYGVVGGPRGHMEGFKYSTAIKGKEGPWSYEELNKWLHQPRAYAPGTRMAFGGIKNEQQRADVIVYLRGLTHSPEPLPSP